MVFFSATGRNHHDLACLAVGAEAPAPPPDAGGLYPAALKVGDSLEGLRGGKAALERHGVAIRQVRDHEVSQSIYLDDPDGNMVELFVDADPAIWAANPAAVAQSRPLALGSALHFLLWHR